MNDDKNVTEDIVKDVLNQRILITLVCLFLMYVSARFNNQACKTYFSGSANNFARNVDQTVANGCLPIHNFIPI